MERSEFVKLVGPYVHHVTLQENLASIQKHGLLRPARLMELCQSRPAAPRADPVTLFAGELTAKLNHQRPLIAGRKNADRFLEGHTLESWADQLDERVFFWPGRVRSAFATSLGDRGEHVVISLPSGDVYDRYHSVIDLAPLNTGSATRRPSPRGDWIYVPLSQSVEAFRTNRIERGLKTTRDQVVEVSLRTDISKADLKALARNLF